jgi:hypothetical protein
MSPKGKANAPARAPGTPQDGHTGGRGWGMSAAVATPCVMSTATAVAETRLPIWRPRTFDGLAFYRKHTVGLLRRYMQTSMEIGRAPCALRNNNAISNARVSHYRLRTFEDTLIFVLDVEKCLGKLDRLSRTIVARVALEDYTPPEAALLTGESVRSVARIYHDALDRLTRLFLASRLFEPNVENLSRGSAENRSNDPT